MTIIRSLLKCALILLVTTKALAADAFFSPDGQAVTFWPGTENVGHLYRVNLKTKVVEKLPLNLPKGQAIKSLACGAEGETFVLTGEAVYIHDPKGTRKLCDVGDVKEVEGLATVPSQATRPDMADWLILSGIDKDGPEPHTNRSYYGRKPGTDSFVPVFSRRIDKVGAGAFTPEGRYFFQADNALWEGSFGWGTEEGSPSLNAMLIAPLAYCDSSISNTGQLIVSDNIAVAGKNVYVVLSGRHGADQLLRVPVPEETSTSDTPPSGNDLPDYYRMEAKTLSSVKVLEKNSYIGSLAATSLKGDERVFYTVRSSYNKVQMMLWTNQIGKAQVIGEINE